MSDPTDKKGHGDRFSRITTPVDPRLRPPAGYSVVCDDFGGRPQLTPMPGTDPATPLPVWNEYAQCYVAAPIIQAPPAAAPKPSAVLPLPNNGFCNTNADIARHLREQADWVEAEDAKPLRTVIVIVEREDGTLYRNTCGKPTDRARVIGLLSIEATRAAMDSDE